MAMRGSLAIRGFLPTSGAVIPQMDELRRCMAVCASATVKNNDRGYNDDRVGLWVSHVPNAGRKMSEGKTSMAGWG